MPLNSVEHKPQQPVKLLLATVEEASTNVPITAIPNETAMQQY